MGVENDVSEGNDYYRLYQCRNARNLCIVRSLTDHELRMAEQVRFSYVDRLDQLEEEL